jgi:hypothetical protein
MFKKILIANRPVIASEAKQSSSMPAILDCRVAQFILSFAEGLLAMTGKKEYAHV